MTGDKRMSSVSVVIPAYNHSRYLRQAVDSALGQTLGPAEVFVVDDGSTDETSQVLSAYGNRIRVIRQMNCGVSSARNNGAKAATGDFLAFLDADDVWLPRKLELQAARFVASPRLGLVHCGVQDINEHGDPRSSHLNGLEGRVAKELLLFRRPVILGGGSGMMIRRAVFERVGGFDEQLSTSADWDLFYRIAARYQIGFVPELLLRYRVHGGNMHANVRAMERDMLRGYAKAFDDCDGELRKIRRRCYGNLHAVLAGSFFSAGQYAGFARHALKSIVLTPDNLMRFAGYPIRRLRGVKGGKSNSAKNTALGTAQ